MFRAILTVTATQNSFYCEESDELSIYNWVADMAISLGVSAEEYELTVIDFSSISYYLDGIDHILNELNSYNQTKASILKLIRAYFVDTDIQFDVICSNFIADVSKSLSWGRPDKAIMYIEAEPVAGNITQEFLDKIKLIIQYKESIYG